MLIEYLTWLVEVGSRIKNSCYNSPLCDAASAVCHISIEWGILCHISAYQSPDLSELNSLTSVSCFERGELVTNSCILRLQTWKIRSSLFLYHCHLFPLFEETEEISIPNCWLRLSVHACWDHVLCSGREHFHCIPLLLRHPAVEKDGKEIGASVMMARLWHKILAFELWSSAVN